ncbi:MAG: hypothetical protein KKE55_07425, partial [Candidatus Omnitrophica bacterium]|nr:hypothetical protein [Candidatus Omnitrophota bacterium]
MVWTGDTFTPGGDVTVQAADTQIASGAAFNINANTLIMTASGTLDVDGTLTITTGSAVLPANLDNSGTINLDGAGTMDIEDNLTNTGTIDSTGAASTINITGNWDNSSGTFTAGAGAVIFDKTTGAQTLNAGASSFYDLQHTQAGTLQLLTNNLAVT